MYIKYFDEAYRELFEVDPFEDLEERKELDNISQMYKEGSLTIEEIDFQGNNYTQEERQNETDEFIDYFLKNEKGVLEIKEVQMALWEISYDNLKRLKDNGIEFSKDFLIDSVGEDFDMLDFASEETLNDEEFMKECCKLNGMCVIYCPHSFLRKNEELIKELLAENPYIIGNLPFKYSNSEEYASIAIENDIDSMEFISDNLKDNKEFCERYFENDRNVLCFVSDRLRNDRDFVQPVLEEIEYDFRDHCYYKHLGDSIKSDKRLIDKVLRLHPDNIKYLPEEYKKDLNYIESLIEKFPSTKKHFDKDLIVTLSEKHPELIGNLNERFKKDESFQSMVVEKNIQTLKYLYSPTKEVFLKAIELSKGSMEQDGCIPIQYDFNKQWTNNFEVMMKSIQKNPDSLQFASEELKRIKDVVLAAVKLDGLTVRHTSIMKHNKEVGMEAVKQNGMSLKFLETNLQNDIEICKVAVENSIFAIDYVSEELKMEYGYDQETFLNSIKRDNVLNKMKYQSNQQNKDNVIEMLLNKVNELETKYDNLLNKFNSITNENKSNSSLSEQIKELKDEVSEYDNEVSKFNKSYGDNSSEIESDKRKQK